MLKKIFLIAIISFLIIISVLGLSSRTQKRTQMKMGTFVEITLNGYAWTNFNKIFDEAFNTIGRVEKLADKYRKDSQLTVVNKNAFKSPVSANSELYRLIERSIDISKDTHGAFDITVSPLLRLWGFYDKGGNFPSQEEISKVLKTVGYKNIILNKNRKTIAFKNRTTELDLSAIAKGYAVDNAVKVIKDAGINSAIVNAGGDIYCLGRKNLLQLWAVGIRSPLGNKEIVKIIQVENKAVATSGGYEQFLTYKGERFSHLINPATGLPVKPPRNATIIAKNCMLADALATAFCILEENDRKEVKQKYDIDSYVF